MSEKWPSSHRRRPTYLVIFLFNFLTILLSSLPPPPPPLPPPPSDLLPHGLLFFLFSFSSFFPPRYLTILHHLSFHSPSLSPSFPLSLYFSFSRSLSFLSSCLPLFSSFLRSPSFRQSFFFPFLASFSIYYLLLSFLPTFLPFSSLYQRIVLCVCLLLFLLAWADDEIRLSSINSTSKSPKFNRPSGLKATLLTW